MTETIQIKVPKWNIESETGYKTIVFTLLSL